MTGTDADTNDKENPLASIAAAISFTPHDWSTHHRLAWIYGIAVGWDDAAMREVSALHNWNDDEVARLRRLRVAYVKAQAWS